MIYTVILILAGICTGIATGLTPSLHPNTVIFVSLPLASSYSPDIVIPYMVSTAVSHSMLNHIPSILVGAPDPNSALATLPGKSMLLEGKGFKAINIGLKGGLYSALFALPIVIFSIPLLKPTYNMAQPYLPFIVSFLFLSMIIETRNIANSLSIAALSSIIGIIGFSAKSVNGSLVLFPLLTGLFGASTMISTLSSGEIPEQDEDKECKNHLRGSLIGSISGFLAGIIPGLGPSGIISTFSRYVKNKKSFLAALGGVNTSDALFSILALYVISKPRSGAAIAVQKLVEMDRYTFLKIIGISLLAISVTYLIGRRLTYYINVIYSRLDKDKLIKALVIGLGLTVVLTTGIGGLGIFLISTSVGLMADRIDVRKSICMACIIFPVLLYMFGIPL